MGFAAADVTSALVAVANVPLVGEQRLHAAIAVLVGEPLPLVLAAHPPPPLLPPPPGPALPAHRGGPAPPGDDDDGRGDGGAPRLSFGAVLLLNHAHLGSLVHLTVQPGQGSYTGSTRDPTSPRSSSLPPLHCWFFSTLSNVL
jgi:hypothetical protein